MRPPCDIESFSVAERGSLRADHERRAGPARRVHLDEPADRGGSARPRKADAAAREVAHVALRAHAGGEQELVSPAEILRIDAGAASARASKSMPWPSSSTTRVGSGRSSMQLARITPTSGLPTRMRASGGSMPLGDRVPHEVEEHARQQAGEIEEWRPRGRRSRGGRAALPARPSGGRARRAARAPRRTAGPRGGGRSRRPRRPCGPTSSPSRVTSVRRTVIWSRIALPTGEASTNVSCARELLRDAGEPRAPRRRVPLDRGPVLRRARAWTMESSSSSAMISSARRSRSNDRASPFMVCSCSRARRCPRGRAARRASGSRCTGPRARAISR